MPPHRKILISKICLLLHNEPEHLDRLFYQTFQEHLKVQIRQYLTLIQVFKVAFICPLPVDDQSKSGVFKASS